MFKRIKDLFRPYQYYQVLLVVRDITHKDAMEQERNKIR